MPKVEKANSVIEAMLERSDVADLRSRLLNWFGQAKRDLPWRGTKDAYRIWISEIMLQQTRVAAVIPYYERFLARFPNVESLAGAPEVDLLACWAGLGYYSRARNLQKAAQSIVAAGGFPRTHADIRNLVGVGDYTSAAVASIAFNLPHAVLDGNVFRVLSRLFNDRTDIKSPKAQSHFGKLADALLDRDQPGDFNQALMELGATICLPKAPQCLLCPVHHVCKARAAQTEAELPIRSAVRKGGPEQRMLFWIARGDELLLWQRPPDARLMPGFWELPERDQLPSAKPKEVAGAFRHGITVHDYRFTIMRSSAPEDLGQCQWVALTDLSRLPMSTILRKAWKIVSRDAREAVAAASHY